jgi:hypothetical protein
MDQNTLAALLGFLAGMSPATLVTMTIIVVVSPFGVLVLVLVFNHCNERRRAAELAAYRDDMAKVLADYGKSIEEVAGYYKDNVKLVTAYEKIAASLQDTVVLNTQTMTRMVDAICTNQFCPGARPNHGASPMLGRNP